MKYKVTSADLSKQAYKKFNFRRAYSKPGETTKDNVHLPKGYKLLGNIGTGAFSQVYLVQNKKGKKYACKVYEINKNLKESINAVNTEMSIYRKNSYGIAQYYGTWAQKELLNAGKTAQCGLLIEYGVPFSDYLNMLSEKKKFLTEKQAAALCLDISRAVFAMHHNDVVNLDLKPGNIILVQRNGHVESKIIDFSIGKDLSEEIESNGKIDTLVAGSEYYIPPAVILLRKRNKVFTKKELKAWDIHSLAKIFTVILNGGKKLPQGQEIPPCSKEFESLLKKMLTYNLSDKIDTADVLLRLSKVFLKM